MQAKNHPAPSTNFLVVRLFGMSLGIFSCRIILDSAASSQYFVPTVVGLQYQGKW